MSKEKTVELPGAEQISSELNRVNYHIRFRNVLRSTIYIMIVVAAVAVLIAVLLMPVIRIYGSSMTPTLNEGEIVVSLKSRNLKSGDIVGVYYGSKLLIKRCAAFAQDWVDIDKEGNVYVNGELLDEPYLTEKAFGECNIELPYQVPDNSVFVLGDKRATSIDSRNSSVGCIDLEDVVGKIVFRIWPLNTLGIIGNE